MPTNTSWGPRPRPRALAVLGIVAAIFPLAGCFNAQADVAISGDDRVSGSVQITPLQGYRSQVGQWTAPEDIADRISRSVTDAATGQMEVRFNRLRFAELTDTLRQLSDDHVDLELDRTGGGQISLSGNADFTYLPGANLSLVIAFPEEVTDTNGTRMTANQVEWQLNSGVNHSVWASSPAGATKRNQFLVFTGVVTAAGVLASVLGMLWARRIRDMQEF